MQKNKSRKLLIILPILLVLLLVIVFLAIKVNTLKHHADDIKTDLKVMAACIKEKDPESAEKALAKSYKDCDALEETLSNSFWQTAAKIPRVKREIEAGEELIGILRTAQDKLLTPLIALMKEKPLTGLKVGDNGFNVRLILSYLDFIESVNPELLSLTEQIQNISTDSFSGGMVGKYKDKIQSLMEMYSKASAYLPVVRAILGNGEDKYYLLTAQNSAEIRASGGFPGSIGTIKITNGLLTIGDFKGVNSVISDSISEASEVTDKETTLFGAWVYAPRDACFIPAFNRTGKIWAVGCEDYQRANGAQDHEEGTQDSEQTEGWDSENTEDWEESSEENAYGTYSASAYDSRLAYYTANSGTYEENTEENGNSSSLSSPTTQASEGYTVDLSRGDGWVFYNYTNDYYGYGETQDEYIHYVDGVISLTPAIIQMLMKTTGDITLSDGTVLNAENATKVLQYDLYHKYFDEANVDEYSDWKADRLFAETAKKVMKLFVSSIDVGRFTDYYEMFQEAAAKRILMIWLADEEEEKAVDLAGLSGQLNHDPDAPQTGVFFSLADPSKLGWYLDIETKVDEVPVINYDGTRTYNVEVTLRNVIDDDDIAASHEYIIGAYEGGIRGYIHFFGPSGGHISDFVTEDDMYMLTDTYQNLEVGYNLDVLINPGKSLTFKYKATTAPFVDAPLTIVHTPTLTEYR